MKALNKYIGLSLLVLSLLSSCKEIIEPDISKKAVTLKSPGDSVTFTSLSPTFSWEPVEDATKYNIQIASPSFAKVTTLIDTVVSKTQFTKQLFAGRFQWRVRAQNVNYLTDFCATRYFVIDSTLDITKQKVLLSNPLLNSYINTATVNFTWQSLSMAKTYSIKVIDSVSNEVLHSKTDLTTTNSSYTFTKSTSARWYVQATDGLTGSTKFEYRNFVVDLDLPTNSLTTTDNQTTAGDSITFSWTSSDKYFLTDSIVFYSADSVTRSSKYLPIAVPSAKLYKLKDKSSSKPTTGTVFFWQIVTVDKAGNKKSSLKRKFTW